MIWHILGAGAIGQLFATRLLDAGVSVCILSRQQLDGYYQLHLQEGKVTRQYQLQTSAYHHSLRIEHLLVCTKAPDTYEALRAIGHNLCSNADILLLQNGMGQHELAQRLFPSARIWAGITTAGAWRSEAHRINCIAPGTTEIGPLGHHSNSLPTGWEKIHPKPLMQDDIHHALWRKLAINCAINPLTAIHQCLNGELLKRSDYLEQMSQVCSEVERLLVAMKLDLFQSSLFDDAVKVAELTAQNRSSMLTDVVQGRTTEIDHITGYLCQEAAKLGIDMPFNQQLLMQVKSLCGSSHHATLSQR